MKLLLLLNNPENARHDSIVLQEQHATVDPPPLLGSCFEMKNS